MPQAFWLDDDYDREHAPDGSSRYGVEVRRRVDEFTDTFGDIAPVAFAAAAWSVATALIPGYVRWHRRIVSARCLRSPWDGSLIGEVNLVSAWPAELTWTRQWERDQGWRDWPQLFGQYVPPSEQDLTRRPTCGPTCWPRRRSASTACPRPRTGPTRSSKPPPAGRSP